MQYTLGNHTASDISVIEQAITRLDPAAVVDFDASESLVRISSVATDVELLACLQQAGVTTAADQFVRLPSQCCGGCGG